MLSTVHQQRVNKINNQKMYEKMKKKESFIHVCEHNRMDGKEKFKKSYLLSRLRTKGEKKCEKMLIERT